MLKYLPLLLFMASCTFTDQKVRNEIADRVEVEEIAFVVDSSLTWEVEDAVRHDADFRPYEGPEINFGHLREALWVRISFKNLTDESQMFFLSSDQMILEDVRLFSPEDAGWGMIKSGWGMSAGHKLTPSYLHSFRFSLEAGEQKTYYLRIHNQFQVVRLPLHLFSPTQFYQHYHFYLFLDGLVTMALITSILYALYNLIFSPKDRSILYFYLLYGVNFLLFYTIRISSPAHIDFDWPGVLNYFVNIFIFTSTYSFTKFGTRFIDPDREDQRKSLEYFIDFLFGLTVIISLFPSLAGKPFFDGIKLVFFVTTIAYLIWYMSKRVRKSFLTRIYFIMAMPLVISGLVEGLTNVFGVLKLPNQFFEAFRISICIEMLYILLAFIYRERILAASIQEKLKKAELDLLRSHIDVQEAEQERIASDLHDDLGSTLASLKRSLFDKFLPLLSGEEADSVKKLAQKAGDDLRRISHALMPPDFETLGLTGSVQELIRNHSNESLKVSFKSFGKQKVLDKSTELNIYRILSEIFQNIHKHSPATQVDVQFIWRDDEFSMMVEDNGSSFNQKTDGMGMRNMKMRADYMGGLINFDANTVGSTIILEIPLQ